MPRIAPDARVACWNCGVVDVLERARRRPGVWADAADTVNPRIAAAAIQPLGRVRGLLRLGYYGATEKFTLCARTFALSLSVILISRR